MLTWQNNLPRFELNGYVGDKITLHFGSTIWDDFDIAVYYFWIRLVFREGRWTLYTQLEQTDPYTGTPEPQVGPLMSELMCALEKGEALDFDRYLDDWSNTYRDFSVVLNGITLPRPKPNSAGNGYKKWGLNL